MTVDPVPSIHASRRRRRLVAAVGAVALVAAGCGSGSDTTDGAAAEGSTGPTVVATTGIWADVVANVACDGQAAVSSVIPVGSDPHAFEPSLSDRSTMDAAALVVTNGFELEEGLIDTLTEVAATGVPIFEVGEHLDALEGGEHDDHAAEEDADHAAEEDADHAAEEDADHAAEDDHDHGAFDPHVWLDPVRVGSALPALADALVADAGLDRAAVDACLAAYETELGELDTEIAEILASIPDDRRKLVTNHDAMAYFADRYGFEVIGTVIPSTSSLAEPNSADLEDLAADIEAAGVSTIFAETELSSDDVEALAERIGGIEVVALTTGSLGEPGSDTDTYASFLRKMAQDIADGLA